ncbi:MAG: hypothetical protein QOJ16_3336, partial [Acidobacteriota bacterium]|nr:hypothetical protein [Acidobacteriota bacterium]
GIDSRLTDENLARLGLSNAIGGVRLQVREEDAEIAVQMLRREARLPEIYLVTDEEARRPRCPGCNSDSLSLERWSRQLLVASFLLLRIPILLPRKRWKCRHCGGMWREEELKGSPQMSEAAEPFAAAERDGEAALPEIDPTALVTVARFTTPWEAHLARTRLEFEGVGACVHEERLPMINLLSGELTALNRLEVIAEDAPRAREILAAGESRANRDQ